MRNVTSSSVVWGKTERLRQRGVILLETLVAISIISTVVLASMTALSTASVASRQVDEETTAGIIVISQIESIKTQPYVATGGSYALVDTPDGYVVSNTTTAYFGGDSNIQKVTVTVTHIGEVVQEQSIVKINR
jgi:type II secretory pathway pseudopilin PulG